MQTKNQEKTILENLNFLPAFAGYIRLQRLNEFVRYQLKLSKELNVPLLKLLDKLSDEELIAISTESSGEFLDFLEQNKAAELIELNTQRWKTNQFQLPQIGKYDIVAEDITLITYVRKQAMLQFIPDYTSNAEQIIELVKEIDLFNLRSETDATNTYIQLLKNRIDDHSHFIEKINNTSPGIIYVFDLLDQREIYSNNKVGSMLGYSNDELHEMGTNVLSRLMHPEDQQSAKNYLDSLKNAKDGEILSFRYRLKDKQGIYRWMRCYETVFRRTPKGIAKEIIGIALDVDREKRTAEELKRNEEALRKNEIRYKKAEALTHLGSYEWDLRTNRIKWSEELFRIYELEYSDEALDPAFLRKYNHPDDRVRVERAIQNTMQTGQPFDFNYRIVLKNGKEKILAASGALTYDENKEPLSLIGTAQDITEKQRLLDQLQHSRELYMQAEELGNMGNWSWDIATNKILWTDQLYKIYGLDPQSEEITIDKFLSFIHPEDKERVEKGIEETLQKKFTDATFRIIISDGKVKVLRSIAKVKEDSQGKPIFVFGTERDITEKQNLIDRLRRSEQLYKQAQSLSKLGNFVWELQTNNVIWSDEVYHIYEIPENTPIQFETAFDPIVEEYKPLVQEAIEQTIAGKKGHAVTYPIMMPSGTVKYINLETDVQLDANDNVISIIGTAQDITERQSLLEKLRRSEQLYKQAQVLVGLGNWTYDLETRTYDWSDEMYRIYELPYGELPPTEAVINMMHPDDREQVLAHLNQSIDTGQAYDFSHRIILKNGKIKYLHRKGEVVFNQQGKAIKLIGTTQDITERERIQQELKDNQTFIRKIADATPSIIASYNINTGNYVFINEGIRKLLDYDPQEVIDKGINFFLDIIHPDDMVELASRNAQALEEANKDPNDNDMVVEFIYRMRHRNGTYKWFHTYGTIFDRNEQGKVDHLLNISLDVTDQVETTKLLQEQEHFLQNLADASPTILYLYDVEKDAMIYMNREIFFVLGYDPDEIIDAGSAVTQRIYHPDDWQLLPERKASEKRFQQSTSMIQYECRMKNKDGEWRWFLVREVAFKTNEQGRVVQIVGAALDIQKRKEIESQLLQNSFQLQQSNASLEEFAYVASHDLKEPLRKISTFGDRLIESNEKQLTDTGKIYLSKIIDASQRMQTMINDLLSISMISGNRSFEYASLQEILAEVLQTLEYKIEQKNAVIQSDPLPEANIVPSQFRQLFQNLLSNSLKFIREDVQPVVRITHEYLSPEEVSDFKIARAQRYHRIQFMDNGIGFDNSYAGKIFTIFQRLHGRSEYEGTGIGLAICKKIVEHHGGVIFANGIENEGAIFTIILPL